jgi:hypothetical protein
VLTFDLNQFIDTTFLGRESSQLADVNRRLKQAVATNQGHLNEIERQRQQSAAAVGTLLKQKQTLLNEIAALESTIERLKLDNAAAQIAGRNAAAARGELTFLEGQVKAKQGELDRLTADLSKAQQQHDRELSRLTTALDRAKATHKAELEALEAQRIERVRAIGLEIESAETALADVVDRQQQIQREMIEAAEREIELSRRQFENERNAAVIQLESDRVSTHKELAMATEAVVERYKPVIEGPLRAEIEALEVELGRLTKKLNAKESKVGFEWTTEQIEALLVRTLEDGTRRPNHLRIAGESESGKSHFVNQLISQGLKHFGLDCDYEVFDPYPSDTRWAIPPTISDDSRAVLDRLTHWKEVIEDQNAAKRERPLVLVCDEADEMIRQYKGDFVECVKAIWKRGRHINVILWLLGQNGNVKALSPLDWSDMKNAGAVYLNQVCFDYLKNAMKGRAMNSLTGELEVIAEKHPYYALVHPKGKSRPYPVAVPKVLFPNTTTTTPPGATAEPAAESTTTAPVCPKCGSTKVKKAGNLNGRQRIKCNDCGKQSYAD